MNINPKRGEIWLVNLDPTIGSEIQRTRPAIVINSNIIGKLPLKLIVPITDWKDYFSLNLWHIYLESNSDTALCANNWVTVGAEYHSAITHTCTS